MFLNPSALKPLSSPPPQTMTANPAPTPAEISSPETEAANWNAAPGMDHMLTFRAPDLDPTDGGADAVVAVGEDGAPLDAPPPEVMSKDAFWVVFRSAFDLPGFMLPAFRPLGIQPGEEAHGRAASDAVYELLAAYFPSALSPMGDNFARLMTAGSFLVMKVMVCREIVREMRRPPPEEKEQAFRPGTRKGAENAVQEGTHVPKGERAQNFVPARNSRSPVEWMDEEAA